MGFRSLHEFNLALLGKQFWNLLQKPNSLVARVMKSKYYPSRPILEAELGYNPSYVWRSLLAAQRVVKEGVRWRIGDGRKVDIWQDRWVPSAENLKVSSPVTLIGETTSVSELLDVNTRSWNQDLLHTHFSHQDMLHILKIPIPRQPCEDRLVWRLEKRGAYTVKTAYHFWRNREEETVGELYTPIDWDRYWGLRVSPKVKVFGWKWIRNILPTRANVVDRIMRGCDECPFCGQRETQHHIFLDCGWVRRVWRPSPLSTMFEKGEDFTCENWMVRLQKEENDAEIGKFLVALWFIWEERNSQLWNKTKLEEGEILGKASRWLEEYLEHQEERMVLSMQRVHRWRPPETTDFKINVDAACLEGGGSGLGMVIRNRQGLFCFAAVRRVRDSWTPEFAELQAIAFGLEIAEQHHLLPGMIESDCQTAIHLLRREERSLVEEGDLVDEIKEMIDRVGSISVHFSGRTSNQVAHILAHSICGWGETESWVGQPPYFILSQLESDSCTISL
ncbi:unnamed protein product [Linum trigynum]|uniref:Uncharacterized protein n=1 Tax=Linum trigynum TaxID=586398 RepID=A0AAV2FZV6_9ROSI